MLSGSLYLYCISILQSNRDSITLGFYLTMRMVAKKNTTNTVPIGTQICSDQDYF